MLHLLSVCPDNAIVICSLKEILFFLFLISHKISIIGL